MSGTKTAQRLGLVTCPSGVLLVLDGGLAWMWSHDRAPLLPEAADIAALANDAVDLAIRGADAAEAGRAFDRSNHPLYLYDRPRKHLDEVRRAFREVVRARRLDATLEVLQERIPHRRRVDLALHAGSGAGIADFHGMWAAAVGGLPRDALTVLGERMADGPDAARWRRVWVEARPGAEVARSRRIGHVLVDEARLLAVDADALGAWNDHDSLDGKADVVFWGRDAAAVARDVGATPLPLAGERDPYGWTDLPLDRAQALRDAVASAETGDRKVRLDFRPHTHHWQVMRDVRATATGSGDLDVGGARLCMFLTSWGDGAFPVEVDLDAQDRVVRVRVELGCDEIVKRQRDMEERWFGAFAKHAFVSARVARDGLPVRFLYREAPDRETDSGWRVFSGDESDAYANDAANIVLMPLRELLERDRELEDLLRTDPPCAFEREARDVPFTPIDGFVPPGG